MVTGSVMRSRVIGRYIASSLIHSGHFGTAPAQGHVASSEAFFLFADQIAGREEDLGKKGLDRKQRDAKCGRGGGAKIQICCYAGPPRMTINPIIHVLDLNDSLKQDHEP